LTLLFILLHEGTTTQQATSLLRASLTNPTRK